MKIKFLIILLVLSLACNVMPLQAKLISKSSKKMPSWIGTTSEDAKYYYFSGSSSGEKTFEKARELAISDALTKVASSLDLTMSVNTSKIITETAVSLNDKTYSKTRDIRILETKIKNIYYERYYISGEDSFNVYVQIEYSKEKYQQEKNRLEQEYSSLEQSATNKFILAKQFIQENKYSSALNCLFETLNIIHTNGVKKNIETEVVSLINSLLASIEIKDSYNFSQQQSGAVAEFNVYFKNADNEVCQKFVFSVLTISDFNIDDFTTDDNGTGKFVFQKMSILKKSNYKIELNLLKQYNLTENFISNYKFYTVCKEPNFFGDAKRIKLDIANNEQLKDIVKSKLVSNGFSVTEKSSDLILNVKYVSNSSDKKYISKNILFLEEANINAELMSNNNNIISSVSFTEKGFGATEKKAHNDLLEKISDYVVNNL